MLTIAMIESRKAQLQAQYDQTVANANALQGAIQECERWLSLLSVEKPNASSIQETENCDGDSGASPLRIVSAQ